MITTEFIDISGAQIPVDKFYEFGGVQYIFKFKENQAGFFTVEVFDASGINMLYSNKIVYGQPIFDTILAPTQDKILPLNIIVLQGQSGTVEINSTTLGTEIKLFTNIT